MRTKNELIDLLPQIMPGHGTPEIFVEESGPYVRVGAFYREGLNEGEAWYQELSNFRHPPTKDGVDYCELEEAPGVFCFWSDYERDVDLASLQACARDAIDIAVIEDITSTAY